jgi:hypothetical protein
MKPKYKLARATSQNLRDISDFEKLSAESSDRRLHQCSCTYTGPR